MLGTEKFTVFGYDVSLSF